MVLVGALWGCTNPLLRRGSSQAGSAMKQEVNADKSNSETTSAIQSTLSKFRQVSVWLPFALNQAGSLVYYITLSSSDLSLAVPICNALALLFSIVSSYALGERVDKPLQAVLGGILVTSGVAICIYSRQVGDVEKKE
jgi:uncharacterized membrane protein